ncbi:uncharacterized protein BDZ83DRAFT_239456 [Colletotrichum acutatum]|uniref:Uncharacterized protein n=1 Tax=Glomerella acutata TaxID=27357 RepID=A0AAD8UM66_GLOAC|nr:uncharacterized protein BDZ83DRAFT_239456 [Colletotrichum acutatum]KAK1726872.1 hypothetical protein BDZ83DRAFT_239456 [Colletotrichum acutatum]
MGGKIPAPLPNPDLDEHPLPRLRLFRLLLPRWLRLPVMNPTALACLDLGSFFQSRVQSANHRLGADLQFPLFGGYEYIHAHRRQYQYSVSLLHTTRDSSITLPCCIIICMHALSMSCLTSTISQLRRAMAAVDKVGKSIRTQSLLCRFVEFQRQPAWKRHVPCTGRGMAAMDLALNLRCATPHTHIRLSSLTPLVRRCPLPGSRPPKPLGCFESPSSRWLGFCR